MKKKGQHIQAVMLAAGRGVRMLPLTDTRPKPMLEVLGKNLIEWKLEALPPFVDDIILIIGHQGEQIKKYFGDAWKGRSIRYVVQRELNGTAGALWSARDLLQERFLVMMGDDLYAKEDIARTLEQELAIGAYEVTKQEVGGEMVTNSEGFFIGINEAKHFIEHGFMNTGLYMLSRKLFAYDPVSLGRTPPEYGLPQTLVLLAKNTPVKMLIATKWLQVTTPKDLVRAEQFVR